MVSREEKTVLMDQLDSAYNRHQTTDSWNTSMLCTYELEHFWYEIPLDQRKKLSRDYLHRFIDYLTGCKMTSAHDVSVEARKEYELIQMLNFNCPIEFKVKYWFSWSEKQQLSALRKLQNARNDKEETAGTGDTSEATDTSTLSTPAHVTRVNVVKQRVEEEPRQQAKEPSAEKITTSAGSIEQSSNQRYTSQQSGETSSNEITTPRQHREPKSNQKATSQKATNQSAKPTAGTQGNSSTRVSKRGSADHANDIRSTEAIGNKYIDISDNAFHPLSLDPRSSREQIAEQFMEIYRNRYSIVFQSISKRDIPREAIHEDLLSLILIISEECRSFAKEQIRSMQDYFIATMSSSCEENTKLAELHGDKDVFPLFEFRRQNAQLSLETLYKRSLKRFRQSNRIQYNHLPIETINQLHRFLSGCASVIWYMTIQETPLVLEHDGRSEADVTRLFHGSDSTNRRLRNVTWPAVRAFQGGPVIEKGVAEFTK